MVWLGFLLALMLLALGARLRNRAWRRLGQGAAVLLAMAASLILARRPGTAFPLPGSRPRPWYRP